MFQDRIDAGRRLAERLSEYANRTGVLVLGLPRGGVPVAAQVAHSLNAPLDILLVRKLGTPGQPELAMGAIASGGVLILNNSLIAELGITQEQIDSVLSVEQAELQRREQLYRGLHSAPSPEGATVILIDDGIATGASMFAALDALRALRPKKIIVAVPVAPRQTSDQIRQATDEFVCLYEPSGLSSIGEFYRDFSQTSDAEVRTLLEQAAHRTPAQPAQHEQRGAA